MMLGNLSHNMVMSKDRYLWLNVICAIAVVAVVVLFCYFCTRRIKRFSPVDAIRNRENEGGGDVGDGSVPEGVIWRRAADQKVSYKEE